MRTLYDILEVSPDASSEVIRVAYRSLAAKYHPDRGASGELFKLIADAYETLSKPNQRAAYDAMMAASKQKTPAGNAPSSATPPAAGDSDDMELLQGSDWSVPVREIKAIKIKQNFWTMVCGGMGLAASVTAISLVANGNWGRAIILVILAAAMFMFMTMNNDVVVITSSGKYVYTSGDRGEALRAKAKLEARLAKSKVRY